MKYFILIIFILGFLFGGIFWEYPLALYIVLVVIYTIVLFFWEFNVLKQKFTGDFEIKSYRKSMDIFNFVMTIFWTVFLLFDMPSDGELSNFKISILSALLLNQVVLIIMHYIYKSKKPITIVIQNDTFIFNNRWSQKRYLKNLEYIGLTSYGTELKLGFLKKSDVIIPMKEYKKKDFRRFLDILVEKSEHDVYLTDDVVKKFPPISPEAVD